MSITAIIVCHRCTDYFKIIKFVTKDKLLSND